MRNASETKQPDVKSEGVEKNGNVADVVEVNKSADKSAVTPAPTPPAPTPAPRQLQLLRPRQHQLLRPRQLQSRLEL